LDAWVARRYQDWQREGFDPLPTVARSSGYTPLPCRFGNKLSGEFIKEPSLGFLQRLVTTAVWIEVAGQGGAGKTMLVVQMARWLAEGSLGFRRLPVVLEDDLPANASALSLIKNKLSAVLGDDPIEDKLLKALLKHGRVVPIFDRLSERREETFHQVEHLSEQLTLGLALVSTRREAQYSGGRVARVYPQPLDSGVMLSFVSTLLTSYDKVGQLSKATQQVSLVGRLVALMSIDEQGGDPGAPGESQGLEVTPLLVSVFVKRAVGLVNTGHSLDELPSSIPGAYADYLKTLNPVSNDVPHYMTEEDMLRAARALARAALGEDYLPQEVTIGAARSVLKGKGWLDQSRIDPIERLKLNGVIVPRDTGTSQSLAFVLDPVCECLGAESHVDEILEAGDRSETEVIWPSDEPAGHLGRAEEAFNALRDRVAAAGEPARSFLHLLEIVWRLRTADVPERLRQATAN
jgi:hypothetical protein